jgi:hypothetical protein
MLSTTLTVLVPVLFVVLLGYGAAKGEGILEIMGYILRRQGKYEEALR